MSAERYHVVGSGRLPPERLERVEIEGAHCSGAKSNVNRSAVVFETMTAIQTLANFAAPS